MLLIISDLHLTDGTSGTTIQAVAFQIFKFRLTNLAYAASCRMVGNTEIYDPIKEIHLLLLGDILDVIRSTKWLDSKVRPWDDPKDPAFITKVQEITHAILQHNHDALQVFRDFKGKGVAIPAARNGKPDDNSTFTVPVLIYYLVGNHDWFFHLPDPAFNQLRASIISELGLANNAKEVFPHHTEDSSAIQSAIQTVCRDHHVFARHGDVYDSNNYEGDDRNRSSLGDAIVIELVDRFTDEARKKLKGEVPKELQEIDNVRPLELIPRWIDGILRKPHNQSQAAPVRAIWNNVVSDFLRVAFVKGRGSSLKWGLRFSKGISFWWLGRIVPWIAPRVKNLFTSLSKRSRWIYKLVRQRGLIDDLCLCAMMEEEAFKNRDISYIVYGHTHRHEIVPLRAGNTTAATNKAIYINSGTWRAVYDPAQYRPKNEEFFGYHVMTYLAFFNDRERKDRSFETWSGSFESPELRSEANLRTTFGIHRPAA
jgi:UDP-2,3-diacylglucosamine pyrophosphatase LpxH